LYFDWLYFDSGVYHTFFQIQFSRICICVKGIHSCLQSNFHKQLFDSLWHYKFYPNVVFPNAFFQDILPNLYQKKYKNKKGYVRVLKLIIQKIRSTHIFCTLKNAFPPSASTTNFLIPEHKCSKFFTNTVNFSTSRMDFLQIQ